MGLGSCYSRCMNMHELLEKFNQGLGWNAFLYLIYKTLFTSLSFLLYYNLSTQDFSTWANINCLIYLLLLWMDFGLRKSIPLFCPEIVKNKNAIARFTTIILIFQGTALLAVLPLFFYLATIFTAALAINSHAHLLYIAAAIFVLEGLVSIIRLVYHAHFWNKQFNLLTSMALIVEMTANISLIFSIKQSFWLLMGIFATKLASSFFITITSLIMLPRLYASFTQTNQSIEYAKIRRAFIIHSGIMWLNNNLKSLTERNFLIPFFTLILGPAVANVFKVANDAALWFYRIVIKTIGVNDTALFAHVRTLPKGKHLMPYAFKQVYSTITALCLPLLGLVALVSLKRNFFFDTTIAFQLFFIVTLGYLLEAVLSPYERLLEVNRNYLLLLQAYVPYIIMVGVLLLTTIIPTIGLLYTIILIHSVRLLSAFLMAYIARRVYGL